MRNADLTRAADFVVYSQFVRGAMNPLPNTDKQFRSPLHFVRSLNTHVVCSAGSKEEACKKTASLDLTFLGYYSSSDYELKYEFTADSKTCKAVIVPVKVYPLLEDIPVLETSDKNVLYCLTLFSDEIERIKIRANKMIQSGLAERYIRLYGLSSLQAAENLFNDARILLRSLTVSQSQSVNSSVLYIIYALNLFIIRAIVLISKYFRRFIAEPPASEDQLVNELHTSLPVIYKYPWLFSDRPALFQSLGSFISGSKVNEDAAPYNKTHQDQKASDKSEVSTEVQALQQLIGSFKLNCNTNIFADVFFQLMHEKKEEGLPYLEADPAALVKVLSLFFKDKSGQHLNSGTFRSMLKQSNISKRPKESDPRKIKIK